MTLDGIRDYRDRVPFEPFVISMVDGRQFHVPHRDFILVPPARSSWVVVALQNGRTVHVNTALISTIQLAKKSNRRRKAG